jgi:hypothetical protein
MENRNWKKEKGEGRREKGEGRREKGEGKDPTVHPARAAGWGGGAKNKHAKIPTGSGQVGHPKAFFGIKGRPPA